jgi:hypothetical protein
MKFLCGILRRLIRSLAFYRSLLSMGRILEMLHAGLSGSLENIVNPTLIPTPAISRSSTWHTAPLKGVWLPKTHGIRALMRLYFPCIIISP